jgi:predicted flap endonuclease-1-like 5' DNA nuclease
MGFLLAKILVLLALAAVCGAFFTYWWFRRHYEDITLEYTRSRTDWADWRRSLEARLTAPPGADLAPLSAQLQAVEDAVQALPLAAGADLAPLTARLEAIEARLAQPPAAEGPLADGAGVAERLASLEALMRRLAERSPAAELTPIDKRLMAIEHALFPVQTRLDELGSAVRALGGGAASAADLTPLLEQLRALRAHLEGGGAPPAKPAVREGSRNLLTQPADDKPDDLTRLRGVDKVLEHTLHRVGVFYFWQIAEWSAEDVEYVDSQLPRFRGRIARDGWVEQAHELAAEPDAARPSAAH